jgi:O-antigen ligase/Tfp pilus assembly protein PilF
MRFHPWVDGFNQFAAWLRQRPTRWVILAVWFFLAITLLSTVLSGSVTVSLWGEIPGQDSYPAYTIVAYVLLFGVISTHLKTKPQLWRLLGAIVAAGVLVSGYGVLQHYGHDFLNLTESTGGGRTRVTSTMGNAVFSASAMSMPISITLLMAALTLREPIKGPGKLRSTIGLRILTLAVMGLWVLVLTVQLLGIIFTFSRGPWVGTILALGGFLGLVGVFVGWRALSQTALVLALATALTLATVEWPGVIALSALAGFLGLMTVFTIWGTARAAPVLGVAVVAAAAVVLAALWFTSGAGSDPSSPTAGSGDSVVSAVESRFTSVRGEVIGGVLGGRVTHWKDSWQLIQHRPWFAFDDLSLPWLRPLIGYGPDLFRYTYLLVTPPMADSLLLIEPDHAHNYFIHQTVEQGILGLIGALGLFLAPFLAGGVLLLRKGQVGAPAHKLVLIGLLAILAGRFVEQMVGVARVSDLTIFWVILAALCALPAAMQEPVPVANPAFQPKPRRRLEPAQAHSFQEPTSNRWQSMVKLAMAAWIIGGILSLTWVRSINYPRAAAMTGVALQHIQQGNPQATLADLDRAIALAPDVPVYYSYRAEVYASYRQNDRLPPERECNQQKEATYDVCLAQQVYFSNLAAVEQRPLYWRSRLALADAAFLLKQDDEAIHLYNEVLSLLPASWPVRNRLATAYLAAGRPEEALKASAESLAINGDNGYPADALFLQGTAYRDLGKPEEAIKSLERSLALGLGGNWAQQAQEMLGQIRSSPLTK